MDRSQIPTVLVSACLLGTACCYDGSDACNPDVRELMEEAGVIPVCPEVLGGLPVPRAAAERRADRVMTKDGTDVTAQYKRGAQAALELARRAECCCAVLKERSPSCGCGMIYDGTHSKTLIPGKGVTAQLLEEEGIPVFGETSMKECRAFLQQVQKLKKEIKRIDS